ncbi:MAG: UvrD-helicase domain-containing protein [Blastomonas fulva]|jgi:DNA helicase-2/ATP-dependent DNA helicase PcrA|uniref:UvrD-helicase domain-containing protein n=1 Tax=Alphaproteobacteria TaxID=28211 RepID=UPI0006B99342|nr:MULTISPECIES: UvrD-helicase domain-containing protein [unclassified Blastomonas]KPF71308.1 DNA helicase UvrD [Blastomonas sp. AAP25]MCO5795191.1 ATP-dependent helicase [Blastomonas sp.]
MFDDLIREQDVAWAAELMGLGPDGFAPVGDDDSRLRAMLNLDTIDFEACPGSGKTTLLVAKLAVLATRWPHRQQGICVLSHTNAARNEIGVKLGNSAAGISLTRYPHFVGTIHAFVNEYLALPWLRSKGLEVQCIDTQIALAMRWRLLPRKTRWAVQKARLSEGCLIYTRPDYTGGSTGKFGPKTPTYEALLEARRTGSEQGYFCFDEMFVWANELLDERPEAAVDLRRRFPLLFVDEAQDNSEAQSALLHRIFSAGDAPSRRQRFGDSNQAIYARVGAEGAATDPFPSAAVQAMPRSYRFAQLLADEVKGLGVAPQELVGAGPPPEHGVAHHAPTLFLFDDASVQSVLPHYGAHLVATFDAHVLERGVFTAVAGVHDLDEAGRVPHAMGHYAPNYDPACARKEAAPASFAQYLARARFQMAGSGNSDKLVNATASALLAASELVGGTHGRITRKSPHRRVTDLLADTQAHPAYLALIEAVLECRGEIVEADWQAALLPQAEAIVQQLSGAGALDDATAFLAWPEHRAALQAGAAPIAHTDNLFVYPEDAPQVRIRLGSIHSVKGETHTATLVLDSFYFAHHLSELKPWLLGAKIGGSRLNRPGKVLYEGSRMLGRLRLHYVAMTRPTHLLCLAMRKDAFDAGELEILTGRGWTVIEC